MVRQPFRGMASVLGRQVDTGTHLQPSKERMKTRGARHEPPSILETLGRAKPSKEKEKVTDSHATIGKVGLSRTYLAERRPPASSAWATGPLQIGVVVDQRSVIELSRRQVRKQLRQGNACRRVRSCTLPRLRRNRKRYWPNAGQDWTRNSTVTGIKALPAEDDLHCSLQVSFAPTS